MINGEARRRGTRGDLQLAVDRAQVRVDGVRADHQPLGDLGVGQTLRDQAQHLDLAGGQAGGVGACGCGWWGRSWRWRR